MYDMLYAKVEKMKIKGHGMSGTGARTDNSIPKAREQEGNEKKNIPKIQEREENEKTYSRMNFRMNFWKNSKRPSTAPSPHFVKIIFQFFL